MSGSMHVYNIWMEGAKFTGGGFQASYVGAAEGKDFKDAVRNWFKKNPSSSFDPVYLTEWGCRLFPSESQARKRFG